MMIQLSFSLNLLDALINMNKFRAKNRSRDVCSAEFKLRVSVFYPFMKFLSEGEGITFYPAYKLQES